MRTSVKDDAMIAHLLDWRNAKIGTKRGTKVVAVQFF